MRARIVRLGVVIGSGVLAIGAGCGERSLVSSFSSAIDARAAESRDVSADVALASPLDARIIVKVDAGRDLPADTRTCFQPNIMTPGLVCFGSDPAPYLAYLLPLDAGPAVGSCPATSDFDSAVDEGNSGFIPCGPLTDDEIARAHDAGAPVSDAGPIVCCYYVSETIGF